MDKKQYAALKRRIADEINELSNSASKNISLHQVLKDLIDLEEHAKRRVKFVQDEIVKDKKAREAQWLKE